ncbi:hypothetical protein MRS76_07320 [Rhizobiaceae bacterium n13]|uniref:Uncharacterized protein n=1 Tax=Ferirhizobium litorale TaxID=2927786 RepID=A0AAE3QBC7_9HYPH|nr:hypothetical protein [Fererhizobium litorale]MDI7861763.1 hypothetical protein [Fererhizobium litorale]MDI7921895.1 hypothetical protein [Fererhizobium litorale]
MLEGQIAERKSKQCKERENERSEYTGANRKRIPDLHFIHCNARSGLFQDRLSRATGISCPKSAAIAALRLRIPLPQSGSFLFRPFQPVNLTPGMGASAETRI